MSRFAQIFEDPDYDSSQEDDYTDWATDSEQWQENNESENSAKEAKSS